MNQKKKSIRDLAEKLKEIRKRPVPKNQIEDFNKVVEKDRPKEQPQDGQDRKIAKAPEVSP